MILVVNAGSSSIKFRLFNDKDKKNPIDILDGLAERITIDGVVGFKYENEKFEFKTDLPNHEVAIKFILDKLIEKNIIKNIDDISGVGFRVVHGSNISKSSIIDKKVFEIIKDAVKLAPLHNPGAITAIEAVQKIMPKAKMVACFDTAFHTDIPEKNYIYPTPYEWYTKYGVRKYGFHGISYQYIAQKASEILNKKGPNLIVCHLGNGASMSCIKDGKALDTTMGLTPLAGLMMGTRSGDVDPSIIEYMVKTTGKDVFEITSELNKNSGLLGVSQKSSDMRDVVDGQKSGDKHSSLALEIYSQTIADFIVKYANKLGGNVDAIIFTAGVGENAVITRKLIMDKVQILDTKLEDSKNEAKYEDYSLISNDNSKIKVFAIRTNEEKMICLDVLNLI